MKIKPQTADSIFQNLGFKAYFKVCFVFLGLAKNQSWKPVYSQLDQATPHSIKKKEVLRTKCAIFEQKV